MGLTSTQNIINGICPPVDNTLANELLNEFISMERRFVLRDWEPTELDGGQFAEILGRIIYHLDSANLSLSKGIDECYRYIENDTVNHNILPRSDAKHIMYVLRTIYKFRSQRGSVHISTTYKPNHMDSKYSIEAVRWCFNEFLRIVWLGNREELAKAIRELLRFDVPCIGIFDSKVLVQRTDLSAEDEIIILLHHAGEEGYKRDQLLMSSQISSQKLTAVLSRLSSTQQRKILSKNDGCYVLTDLGNKYLRDNLGDKLILE
jgi:hypothetical protein